MIKYIRNLVGGFERVIKGINLRKLKLYGPIAIGIMAVVVILILVQGRMNRLSQKDFDLAMTLYQEASNTETETQEKKTEKFKEATNKLKKALSSYPWAENRSQVLFYLANCYYALEDYDLAQEILEKWIKKYPDDYFFPLAQFKLASIREQKGETSRAIEIYQELIERYPNSALAPQAVLGKARCQEILGEWNKAFQDYQELISRYPLSEAASLGKVRIEYLRVEDKIKT